MKYYILKNTLGENEIQFDLSSDSMKNEVETSIYSNLVTVNYDTGEWIIPTFELFELTAEDSKRYFEDEGYFPDNRQLYTDYRYVVGAGTSVYSDKLKNYLEKYYFLSGKFLQAKYLNENWYFYYCKNLISNAINLKESQIDYFSDGRIMVLHKPCLYKSMVENLEIFRLVEYPIHIIVSEKIRCIFIEHNIQGAEFTEIKLT